MPDNEAVRKDTEANYKRIEAQFKDNIQQQIRLHKQSEEATRRELDREKQSRAADMEKSRREASEREYRLKRDFEERLATKSSIFEEKLREVRDAQASPKTSVAWSESPPDPCISDALSLRLSWSSSPSFSSRFSENEFTGNEKDICAQCGHINRTRTDDPDCVICEGLGRSGPPRQDFTSFKDKDYWSEWCNGKTESSIERKGSVAARQERPEGNFQITVPVFK